MSKVSVIIPNYNHADFLKRRLDSVLRQTYQDFEVIILDDCSTDNSPEILNNYRNHPKVSHIIFNKKNTGSPFKQWNNGFEIATGEFIWIAESDDWCEPDLLETLIKPLEDDASVVLSFCQTKLVDAKGDVLYQTECNEPSAKISGEEFVKKYLFGDTLLVNAGMVVFRRSALSDSGSEYLGFKGAGDWMFWIGIAGQGYVYFTDRHLNYCYRHDAALTNKSETSGSDFLEGNIIFRHIVEHFHPSKTEIEKAIKQRIQIFHFQRKKYLTKEIALCARNDLFSLQKNVFILYNKYQIKRYLKSFLRSFKK